MRFTLLFRSYTYGDTRTSIRRKRKKKKKEKKIDSKTKETDAIASPRALSAAAWPTVALRAN
jgi:hypothetical protein